MSPNENLNSSPLCYSLWFLKFLISLLLFFIISLFLFIFCHLSRIYFKRFLTFPYSVSFYQISDLSSKVLAICNPLNFAIVVPKLSSWNPLLVIECQKNIYWLLFNFLKFFFRFLDTSEQPCQRRYNALQALKFSIPSSRNDSLPSNCFELHSLICWIIKSLSNDL